MTRQTVHGNASYRSEPPSGTCALSISPTVNDGAKSRSAIHHAHGNLVEDCHLTVNESASDPWKHAHHLKQEPKKEKNKKTVRGRTTANRSSADFENVR